MNATHFNPNPLLVWFTGFPPTGREHELFTRIVEQRRTAAIYCRCGWSFERPLVDLYSDRNGESFRGFETAAAAHIGSLFVVPLAELESWGWFDPEVL